MHEANNIALQPKIRLAGGFHIGVFCYIKKIKIILMLAIAKHYVIRSKQKIVIVLSYNSNIPLQVKYINMLVIVLASLL